MLRNIEQIKRDRDAHVQTMRALVTVAEARADKSFTAEENTQYSEASEKLKRFDVDISRETEIQAAENRSALTPPAGRDLKPEEFRNMGEFLQEVRDRPNSERLQARDVTMGNGPSAGFLVPEAFDPRVNILQGAGPAIVRPRAMVLPGGTSPDAAITINALDQNSAIGVYSGVAVNWIAENAARIDAGDPLIRQIRLEPNEVSGFIDVSDKLLRNADAAGALVTTLLRSAIVGSEEDAFYTGSGVGQPLGIIGHPSSINITRAGALGITYADVSEMYARAKFGGSYIWVASQTTLPQLMVMVDGAGRLLWQPNAREGAPGTLLGIPVVLNDQAPVLGSQGDLALVDLQYYAIKDGSPLAIFIDPYTQKLNGVTRIYSFWNVDGQPMLTTPMLQRDGVSTVSPFVVLN